MAKLLYIKANPKSNQSSRTFIISEHFIKVYKEFHPNDQIITLDLYKEGIHFLSQEDINDIFAPKTEASKHHHILKYAYQFAEADKYVFAAPMWNLGIPAILKAYIDYITVSGITFKYTEQGLWVFFAVKKQFISWQQAESTKHYHFRTLRWQTGT